MGWWSAQFNDYRSPLVEHARTAKQFKGQHTERDHRLRPGGFSVYSVGAFTRFLNDNARCGSKPARWRCRSFFTKEVAHPDCYNNTIGFF
jgi:hypothetical protein